MLAGRVQGGDTSLEPEWAAVFRSYDIISPWSVGRYSDSQGISDFRTTYLMLDVAEATAAGAAYMPVIWPGFSWKNLNNSATPLNQIPRDGGRFYNLQSNSALSVQGINMIYIAMFDEVDEGTAMFTTG